MFANRDVNTDNNMPSKNIAWYEGGVGSHSGLTPCHPSTPAARALQMYLAEEPELKTPMPADSEIVLNRYSETRDQLIERDAGIVWLHQNPDAVPASASRDFALYAE
ncbi:MAG: hypothetical protein AAF512_09535 [Pseudomonadota bacterium]